MPRTFLRTDDLIPFLDLLRNLGFGNVLSDVSGRVNACWYEDVD